MRQHPIQYVSTGRPEAPRETYLLFICEQMSVPLRR